MSVAAATTAPVLQLAPRPAPAHPDPQVAALLARHRALSYADQVLCGGYRPNAHASALPQLEAQLAARGISVPEYR